MEHYRVPFVNYPKQYLGMKMELDAVYQRIKLKGDYISREDNLIFEANLATYLGVKHAIGVSSGTDALFLSLKAIGIQPGDEVITVAHTFVASIAAIAHAGGTPVLVDVDYNDMEMDFKCLEKAITSRTKAIIPVHFNGRMCEMDKIMRLARRENIKVIEDSCQALGSRYDNKLGGTWGDTGCFSFYPAKILGCDGDGGAVVTNDDEIARQIRLYRDHGRDGNNLECYGWTKRLDNYQAAILSVKLQYLDKWIEKRRRIASIYYRGLREIKGLKLPHYSDLITFDNYQNYVIRAPDRDRLASYLDDGGKGVKTIISNPIPIHKQPKLGLTHFNLPVTERLANEVITLPGVPELEESQVLFVIERIKDFYR